MIASGDTLAHMNPYGGEERIWLGPEGGQFSIFFKAGDPFDFEHWYTPKEFDTDSFRVVNATPTSIELTKDFKLTNRSGTKFQGRIDRRVTIRDHAFIKEALKVSIGNLSAVAYTSSNTITNTGNEPWTKEKGLLSIWMLGMMVPSPYVTAVASIHPGDTTLLGKLVNTNYFGDIPSDRLQVRDSVVFFKADGAQRGKIGIPPLRVKRFIGSYDAKRNILTLLETEPPETQAFVNSAWEQQEYPFGGDALNIYNDGPLGDGSQLGPFYELEASSAGADLEPQESLVHSQTTYHLQGARETLDLISKAALGVTLHEIETAFSSGD